jgi:hypothetical protein
LVSSKTGAIQWQVMMYARSTLLATLHPSYTLDPLEELLSDERQMVTSQHTSKKNFLQIVYKNILCYTWGMSVFNAPKTLLVFLRSSYSDVLPDRNEL